MTALLWRIATERLSLGRLANDLSGIGAAKSGGRWNSKERPVVYAAQSIALACLETLVHLNANGLPLTRYLVRIEVPDDLWAQAEVFKPNDCPDWDALPEGPQSKSWGDAWLQNHTRPAILLVPSVIVPEEWNALINPAHQDAARITAQKLRKWDYDARLPVA